MKLSLINEEVVEYQLSNGLTVYQYNDPYASEYYACYTTRFGANDLEFKGTKLPAGIAHYLEHVMFASKEGDFFDQFAKYNANANAYTSYRQTSYLFNVNEAIIESLEVLIKLVQTSYFTKEVVEKERGIISEEIAMYDQMPQWRIRNLMFESLCNVTNYKVDIAGTGETIEHITPALLQEIYDYYYQPENQFLVIYGNFEHLDIRAELERMQIQQSGHSLVRDQSVVETNLVHHKEAKLVMQQVSTNYAITSLKFDCTEQNQILDYISLAVFCESYFSNLNPVYIEMLQERKINQSLNYSLTVEHDIKFISFSYQSNTDIEQIHENICDYLKSIQFDRELIGITLNKIKAFEVFQSEDRMQFIENLVFMLNDEMNIESYYKTLEMIDVESIINNLDYLFSKFETSFVKIKKV